MAPAASAARSPGGLAAQIAPRTAAIFNVKYSPNLGDGIIAECLERTLSEARPDLAVLSIDLAGRQGFDRRHGRNRKITLALREMLPKVLRSRLVPLALRALVHRKLGPRWARQLTGCQSAVIGGGALFADADQNFPIKLAYALDLCRARDLPVAIASVGVSADWSRPGKRRLLDGLAAARIVGVTARDEGSIGAWSREFEAFGLPPAALAPDPGLLCRDVFPRPRTKDRSPPSRRRVAMGVTDPMVLRLHGDPTLPSGHVLEWLKELAGRLLTTGVDVVLFTNGSQEDERFCDRLEAELGPVEGLLRAPRFSQPADLARFIAAADCVVAYRLHALIAAYSYGVPAIGLAWDRKLESFFAATGRDAFVIDTRATSPGTAVALVDQAIADLPDPATRERLIADTRAAIARLADQLADGVA